MYALAAFCREHNLNKLNIWRLVAKGVKNKEGWSYQKVS